MGEQTVKPIVYLVDDDPSMLRALSRLLTLTDHAVQTFPSATDFLNQHQPANRGCVVADLRMPGPSGLDLQSALARSGNPLPVVFLTGHGDIPTSVHAMKGGAEDFLTKPPRKEDLLAAVARALARDAAAFEQHAHQRELHQRFELLTPREREVLTHVIAGRIKQGNRRRPGHRRRHHQGAPREHHGKAAGPFADGARPHHPGSRSLITDH